MGDQFITIDVMDRFDERRGIMDVRKEGQAGLSSRLSLCRLKEINRTLLELDADYDGVVSIADVHQGFQKKWSTDIVESLIKVLQGGTEDDSLGYEEAMGELIAASTAEENEILGRIFYDVDRYGDGHAPKDVIGPILKQPALDKVLSGRDPSDVLKSMATDSATSNVRFADFRRAIQGCVKSVPATCSIVCPRPQRYGWNVGTELDCRPQFGKEWEPCVVEGIDERTGAVQVDCRPGYWFRGMDLYTQLRKTVQDHSWFSWLRPRKRWASTDCCSLCVNRAA